MNDNDELEAVRKGQELADVLGLKPKKDGYYHTGWGRKTAAGLYRTVQAILEDQEARHAA